MMLESTNSDCKELVQILVEKSNRLKEAAKDPSLLSSTVQKLSAYSGLTLVGEENNDNETASKIVSETIKAAKSQADRQGEVDSIIGGYARTLKQMIDSGAEMSEDFENELLGLTVSEHSISSSFMSLQKPSLSRNVSYKKDFGAEGNFVMETAQSPGKDGAHVGPSVEILDEGVWSGSKDGKKSMVGFGSGGMGAMGAWKMKRDELNLSGLLNVLDGVVDTPGRMLIMTTNHPEMLDPALIRPGRIDKKMFLGYLKCNDMILMLEHYFQGKLDQEQRDRVKCAVSDPPQLKLTPAQVEQMACEHEEIEDMISALEEKKSLCFNYVEKEQIVY
jgi:SpoVK/Ycf46/Vps4 family AAA+-type ATPase